MGEHLVLCRLRGTGHGYTRDGKIDPAGGFDPDLPASVLRESHDHWRELRGLPALPADKWDGATWRRADVPEDDDLGAGYFGIHIYLPEARLDELVADGTIAAVVYRDPDLTKDEAPADLPLRGLIGAVAEGKTIREPVDWPAERAKVRTVARTLPARESKTVVFTREKQRRDALGPVR